MQPYRAVDGSNNNPDNPDLGRVDSQLLRVSNPDYGDGASTLAGDDRPMAREISNAVFAQSENTGNAANNSDFLWLWGQFIDHDMSITENGLTAEDAAMSVPTGDLMFDPLGTGTSSISFTRSAFDPETGTVADNPRQQVNQITPFIDASNIYGSDKERMDALRGDDGKLIMSDGGLLNFNTDGLPLSRIEAQSALLEEGGWSLKNAKLWPLATSDGRPANPERDAVVHQELFLPTTLTEEQIRDSFAEPSAISVWELPAFIQQLENAGFAARAHSVYLQSELALRGSGVDGVLNGTKESTLGLQPLDHLQQM